MSDTEPYCFSKQQLRAAPQHHCHGVIVTSTPTPSWMRTTSIASQCQLCKYSCCRDPVSCLLPALSHRPVLRNISMVNVLLYSEIARLLIALLKAASRCQSSGGVVVRLFCLPYMIETNLFSSKAEQSHTHQPDPLRSKTLHFYCALCIHCAF